MRRILLLCFVISAFALANWPSLVHAEKPDLNGGAATPESTGAQQTGAQGEITKAQQELSSSPQTPNTNQQIKQAGDSCKQALDAAKNACNESTSPAIQKMMKMLPDLAKAVLAASGKDKCNAMAQGLDMLKGLQGDYSSDCGAKKQACTKACSDGNTKISQAMSSGCQSEALQKNPMNPQSIATPCQTAAQKNQQAVSQGVDACNALQANENAGKANEQELGQGQQNSEECSKDEAVDCSKTPDDASCPKVVDCNKMANNPTELKKYPQCACVLSPNGCNGQTTTTTNPYGGGDEKPGTIPDGATVGGVDSPEEGFEGGGKSGTGGGLPGMAGGADGGVKGGAGADKEKSAKEKPKTEVLGGDSGGGGMKSSGNSNPYDDGGKQALADKINKQAEADKLAKQVSGSHGLTNWEKVNTIAKENGSKLIPDRK